MNKVFCYCRRLGPESRTPSSKLLKRQGCHASPYSGHRLLQKMSAKQATFLFVPGRTTGIEPGHTEVAPPFKRPRLIDVPLIPDQELYSANLELIPGHGPERPRHNSTHTRRPRRKLQFRSRSVRCRYAPASRKVLSPMDHRELGLSPQDLGVDGATTE
jgi:hypothetical protein